MAESEPPPDDAGLAPLLTMEDVAKRLALSVETVRQFIRKGELKAINVSVNRNSQRPSFRVRQEDLAAFELSRSTAPPPPPQQRRHKRTTKRYV